MAVILDSGNRRQFNTGAVRDIQEGKGRCDLLPLDVIADWMPSKVIECISNFKETGDVKYLWDSINAFQFRTWNAEFSSVSQKTAHTLLEVAKHFEEGAKKYGECNWQKGIPVHCYIDSAVRHYLKWLRGDTDEPHDRAFIWNILCCIWTIKHKPEMNDLKGTKKQ